MERVKRGWYSWRAVSLWAAGNVGPCTSWRTNSCDVKRILRGAARTLPLRRRGLGGFSHVPSSQVRVRLDVSKSPQSPFSKGKYSYRTQKSKLEATPASPGTPTRVDDEYKRCGTANIFLCVEPLSGKTVVEATARRTRIDFAHFLRDLCDGPYRDASKIVIVMDNLNTHSSILRGAARTLPLRRRGLGGFSHVPSSQARGPLHAQARELARHRRDRALCPGETVPSPAHWLLGRAERAPQDLEETAQR